MRHPLARTWPAVLGAVGVNKKAKAHPSGDHQPTTHRAHGSIKAKERQHQKSLSFWKAANGSWCWCAGFIRWSVVGGGCYDESTARYSISTRWVYASDLSSMKACLRVSQAKQ